MTMLVVSHSASADLLFYGLRRIVEQIPEIFHNPSQIELNCF